MDAYLERARRIHSSLPVVDGHNDFPWKARVRAGGDLDVADPSTSLEGYHTDLGRLRDGGVGAQFWSVFVPAWTPEPFRTTLEQIELVEAMVQRHPDRLEFATTSEDVERIRSGGRTACLLGAEGGHVNENSLEKLRDLFDRGVRYLTLTHADTIDWADSATDEERHGGLTDFGEEVVMEMNRLGMMVDISHVSAATMRHVLRISRSPVIASHSSAYALAPHPRNVPDDVLEFIAGNDGIVMVNFYPGFITATGVQRSIDMFEQHRAVRARFGPNEEAEFVKAMDELAAANPIPRGSVTDVVDHIEHIARVAGINHVGLGSDFDGIDIEPEGLEDVTGYPNISAEMFRRGWHETDLRKVLGNNILRVMQHVEAAAAP